MPSTWFPKVRMLLSCPLLKTTVPLIDKGYFDEEEIAITTPERYFDEIWLILDCRTNTQNPSMFLIWTSQAASI